MKSAPKKACSNPDHIVKGMMSNCKGFNMCLNVAIRRLTPLMPSSLSFTPGKLLRGSTVKATTRAPDQITIKSLSVDLRIFYPIVHSQDRFPPKGTLSNLQL